MLSQGNFTPVLNALMTHNGVYAVVIANSEGFPLTFRAKDDNFTGDDAELTAALFSALLGRAKNSIQRLDRGEVTFFTLDTTSGEILVAIEEDYVVIAIRDKRFKQ
jgi:predicted regulator of Ras-like GTPase activity (Roadblock/LC7/MglB family)